MLTGPWQLEDLRSGHVGLPKNGLKVFSCFHCGGGSSMGYRLAGYDVLGGVEIDHEMMSLYRINIRPQDKFSFQMPIQEFNKLPMTMIPDELKDLDILDGSPPCSSFSMAGSREDGWGKEKKFREGQAKQVLDDLFFQFIDTVEKLRPKVVVAENVKGILLGNARGYVLQVMKRMAEAGYETQIFLLNSARMGVPQTRERVFFIGRRCDLNLPPMKLEFKEHVIPLGEAIKGRDHKGDLLSECFAKWWRKAPRGKSFSYGHPKGSFFNSTKLHPLFVAPTLIASGGAVLSHWDEPRKLSDQEMLSLQTFPDDYEFLGKGVKYVLGMSVPPFMMMRLSHQIQEQLFSKILRTKMTKVLKVDQAAQAPGRRKLKGGKASLKHVDADRTIRTITGTKS